MSESLFRKLWFDKLPVQTSQILATLPDDLDLLKTAEIADKMNDVAVISCVDALVSHETTMADTVYQLQQQLERLSTQIEYLRRGPTKNSYKSRRRSNSSSRPRQTTVCWYHHKFGDSTRKCTKPCTFKQQTEFKATQKAGNAGPSSA